MNRRLNEVNGLLIAVEALIVESVLAENTRLTGLLREAYMGIQRVYDHLDAAAVHE